MEINRIVLGRACDGSKVFSGSKHSVSVSREIDSQTKDPLFVGINKGIGDVINNNLDGKNGDGGGVPEMKKVGGFGSWASSVNEFRAFRMPKHSSHGVSMGVNNKSNVKTVTLEGNNTSIGSERAIIDDRSVTGVKIGEGETIADEGASAQLLEMNMSDALLEDFFINGMEKYEEKIVSDEKNVVGVIEQGTFVNVDEGLDMDLDAQNLAGGKHLSEYGIAVEGISVEDVLNESSVSLYDLRVNNVASPYKGVCSNENVVNDPMEDLETEENDGNIVKVVSKVQGEKCVNTYYPTDLVWGKVRRNPWWPGQIFERSAASENAMKHSKEGTYLVAYFGKKTFTWNESTKIKPFYSHFTEMKKQSNLGAFARAVSCALDEVSRRVELGLTCLCLPQEQRAKIETQIVVNGGIQEEASKIFGGDNISKTSTIFAPAQILQELKSLALSPKDTGTDKLKLVTAKSQLVAFHRWKGFCEQRESVVSSGGAQSGISDKKSAEKQVKKRGRPPLSSSKEQKPIDSNLKKRKKNDSPKIDPVLESSKSVNAIDGQNPVGPDIPQPDDMLPNLFLAAASDPIQGYKSLFPYMSLFSNYRNSVCLDNKAVPERKKSGKKHKEVKVLSETESLAEASTQNLDIKEEKDADMAELEAENTVTEEEYTPTSLSLKFTDLESLPSVEDLIKIFSQYGPLNESLTEVMSKTKRAKVVFMRRADAETASSNAEKSSMFGASLVCYNLKPLPIKAATVRKRNKKAAKSA